MSDTVGAEKIVSFRYTLRDAAGEVIDASGDEAMPYLVGAQNIVPGLEKAMIDRAVGDSFEVTVPAAEGYGERVEGSAKVPRSEFPDEVELQPGMSLVAEGPEGSEIPLWITDVGSDEVTVDPNHPLAGVDLHFEVEVVEIRDASKEELEHGHPHGPGGHDH